MTKYTFNTLNSFVPTKEKRFTDLLVLHKVCYPDFPMSTVFYAYKYGDIDMEVYKKDLALYRKIAKENEELFNRSRACGCHFDRRVAVTAFYGAKSVSVHRMMLTIKDMA